MHSNRRLLKYKDIEALGPARVSFEIRCISPIARFIEGYKTSVPCPVT